MEFDERGDGWVARIEVSVASPTARMDFWLGVLGYLVACGFAAYVGLLLGTVGGTALASMVGIDPELGSKVGAAVAVGLAVLAIGSGWLREVGRGTVVYILEATATGLAVRTERTGLAWLPLGWLRAVEVPVPWPSAVQGSLDGFTIDWAALRGATVEPHLLSFELSAERSIGLALRGADLQGIEAVIERVRARL